MMAGEDQSVRTDVLMHLYMQQLKAATGTAGHTTHWPMKENGPGGNTNDSLLNRAVSSSCSTVSNTTVNHTAGTLDTVNNSAANAQSCTGCRELKREVEDLRRMICQFLGTNRSQSTGNSSADTESTTSNALNFIHSTNRNSSVSNQQPQQSPPPPPPAIRHSAQCPSALSFNNLANCNPQHLLPWLISNGLLSLNSSPPQIPAAVAPNAPSSATSVIKLLEQMPPSMLEAAMMGAGNRATSSSSSLWQGGGGAETGAVATNNSRFADLVQAASALQQHQSNNNGNIASNGNANNSHHTMNLHGITYKQENGQFIDPVGIDGASETSSSASSTNNQLMISPQQQLNASLHQQFGSGNNCLNTNNQRSAFEMQSSHMINAVNAAAVSRSNNFISAAAHLLSLPNMQTNADNGSTSAAVASLLQQHQTVLNGNSSNGMQQSPLQSNLALHASLLLQQQQQKTANQQAAAAAAALHQSQQQFHKQQQVQQQQNLRMQQQQQQQSNQQQYSNRKNSAIAATTGNTSTNNEGMCLDRNATEKRRAASDDYVRIIRQQNLSEDCISKITIPVSQAYQVDPLFRPLSEQQVVQQVMQSKKYENVNVAETMAQLCKKLAEKRVFGSRLMSQTTVAAPNHSSYNNLPSQGIVYIQHVCRKVLGSRVKSDEEFWEYFREAMRKLAARCRRVRHAKKMRSPKVSVVEQHVHQQQQQPARPTTQAPLPAALQLQQQQQQLLFEHRHRQQQHQQQPQSKPLPPFNTSSATFTAFELTPPGDGEAMDVAEAESSSSPSPQTPMSSSTHHSTPTPVLTDIKIEALAGE